MPMCPQRMDLANAIRHVFIGHGIPVKKLHTHIFKRRDKGPYTESPTKDEDIPQ
jgi:hypothetical protein